MLRLFRGALVVAAAALTARGLAAQEVGNASIRTVPIVPRTIASFSGREIDEVITSSLSNRIYYTAHDTLWLFDRATKTSTQVAAGDMWNIDLSPRNDRLVFARNTEDGNCAMVWTLPLDKNTGLASGPARRLGLGLGDQPRFSPDGQSIAYAVYDSSNWDSSQRLVVIPANGGSERVVSRMPRGIGRVAWSPDGRSLYFISPAPAGQPKAMVYRVSASGGVPVGIAPTVMAILPGLSPDGRTMILRPTIPPISDFPLADANGKIFAFAALPPSARPAAWSNSNALLVVSSLRPASLRSLSLGDGTTRELMSSAADAQVPVWSPNGKQFAVGGNANGKPTLIVMNADGTARRVIPIPATGKPRVGNLWWSPDGRYIAMHGEFAGDPLIVVGASDGSARRLGIKGWSIGQVHWRSDSRAVQYTALPMPRLPGNNLRQIREASLDGTDRQLGEWSMETGAVGMINDSTALLLADSGSFAIPVRSGRAQRLTNYRTVLDSPNQTHTRLALRRAARGGDTEIEIVDLAGARQERITLSGFASPSNTRMEFLPDGRSLVLVGESGGRRALYQVPVDGSAPRKLADLPKDADSPKFSLSPDGKHLLYTVSGAPTSTLAEANLSALRPK
jgi:Tol biopolymer transport system component